MLVTSLMQTAGHKMAALMIWLTPSLISLVVFVDVKHHVYLSGFHDFNPLVNRMRNEMKNGYWSFFSCLFLSVQSV